MFEKMTDRLRKVMAKANGEAQTHNMEYIGVEHLLMGLLKEGTGVGVNLLNTNGVDIDKLKIALKEKLPTAPNMVTMGKLPHTLRAKTVLSNAGSFAREMKKDYVGTEHLVFALLMCSNSIYDPLFKQYKMTPDKWKDIIKACDMVGYQDTEKEKIRCHDCRHWPVCFFAKQIEDLPTHKISDLGALKQDLLLVTQQHCKHYLEMISS